MESSTQYVSYEDVLHVTYKIMVAIPERHGVYNPLTSQYHCLLLSVGVGCLLKSLVFLRDSLVPSLSFQLGSQEVSRGHRAQPPCSISIITDGALLHTGSCP